MNNAIGQVQTINEQGRVVIANVLCETPEHKGAQENPPRLDLIVPGEIGRPFKTSKGNESVVGELSFYISQKCRYKEQYVFLGEDAEVLREFARKSLVQTVDESSGSESGGSNIPE